MREPQPQTSRKKKRTRSRFIDSSTERELEARRRLDASTAAITTALAENGTAENGTAVGAGYVRSASLFAHVADMLPDEAPLSRPQLALRDLQLLDGAMAEAARWAAVPVTEAGQPQLT